MVVKISEIVDCYLASYGFANVDIQCMLGSAYSDLSGGFFSSKNEPLKCICVALLTFLLHCEL